jgi:hypothetical protein
MYTFGQISASRYDSTFSERGHLSLDSYFDRIIILILLSLISIVFALFRLKHGFSIISVSA